MIRDLENVAITAADGSPHTLAEVARVSLGSQPRRGILEKDGTEATGGVVLMRHGENALEVSRRLRAKIQELQPGLPLGVRIVVVYDRTPLIQTTITTVTRTLTEAILTATVCIILVLRHVRTALVVAVTLPLAVLLAFGLMGVWHGTAARYLAYGLYHALLIVGYGMLTRPERGPRKPLPLLAARVVTFHLVCFGFLIFSGRLF